MVMARREGKRRKKNIVVELREFYLPGQIGLIESTDNGGS